MTALSEVRGLPVVTLDEAREVGVFDSVALDAPAGRITHVRVTGRRRGSRTALAWHCLHAIGPDAVLVESEVPPGSEQPAAPGEVLGSRVLSEDGDDRGTVRDVVFDPATGRVEKVLTTLGEVSGDRLLGLGEYALVVRRD
ncbi:PRC-barrel domain-containing protein [Streptomyces sp. NPDC048664]|uniref:PRC-barrel domain-containing protein n=1 Tax=Streptomyces sp. NPDC048664 TaxID=3154505 RepID=UPI003430E1F0